MNLLKKLIKVIARPVINKHKGKVGEALVDSKLNPWIFENIEHRQINNLILVDDNDKSHQIDHIEIRQNGIFCIETKNYSGWVFGSDNQDKWTQTLRNGEKHQFINPLKQNQSHIYHISKVLGKKYKINSVVVMVQNNADKINCNNVVNLDNLKAYLKHYNDGTHYSTLEMDEIYNKLVAANSSIKTKAHVNNIKKTQKELKKGICPRCGGKLVKRNGQYGNFFGCTNYPKCRFILKNK